ncbi:DUF6587 family protein [Acetobacter oeni]|uniref:Uncharacterized protein n=2 Tax=Acetobacter oeni TaxID=304077 RepID=A0A511XPG7_9PROT|nr:DUF6587 family protein [Acetobacter oeni]MBB3881859.1 hypothetical protein [Acetobacter oeni]GEN64851.1 hypothetical protein AOE01nite_30750 [Acetobacter oeni]
MIEVLIVGVLVVACGLYWLGRLAPSVTRGLWRGTGRVLDVVHAPVPVRQAVAGRAGSTSAGGCGGCKGCGKDGGGCH